MKEILILKEKKSINNIQNSKDLFNKIQKINIDYSQENFLLVCLNTTNKILYTENVFKGGLNACLICPKTLFRKALLKNSNSIIIAHNHPSKNLNPSNEDIQIYKDLKEIGDILGLTVLDSIIFNKNEFYSLNDIEVLK